jgi:Brp/Blh family beta-carotene 15,15'-monooxygenase
VIRKGAAIGWGVLLAGAGLASIASLPVQLGFAVVAIGVIGMAHGASDLAIVAPARRTAFLACYLTAAALCLLWWLREPAAAMPLFLLASALHFGLEDGAEAGMLERLVRGVGLVTVPAALHPVGLTDLLAGATGQSTIVPAMVQTMRLFGLLAGGALLSLALPRRDGRLLAGTLALLLPPPLVGFSLGFLILHALPQTDVRRERIGCRTVFAYLRAVAPILALALVMAGACALLLVRRHGGVEILFACMAALAVPHLLVTPWFEGAAQASRPRRPLPFRPAARWRPAD